MRMLQIDQNGKTWKLLSLLTFLTLSTSPQGNLLVNSIPVSGVFVGCSNIDASIVRYSTFNLLFCQCNRRLRQQ